MSKPVKVIAAVGSVASIVGAIYFAPAFIWQLAYNMQWPFTILTVVVGIISIIMISASDKTMKRSNRVTEEYLAAEWRLWTAVNCMGIFGLLWTLIWAVPSPDFKKEIVTQYATRVVEKPVVKWKYEKVHTVYHTPTYAEALKLCFSGGMDTGPSDRPSNEQCHRQAIEASLPPYRTRIIKVPSNYKDLFKQCLDSWNPQGINIDSATKLTAQCTAYAERGSK